MTSGQLDRIRVRGFKSIREADVKLNALNILIGANGAGKSNFISLFRLLNEIMEQRLQVYSGAAGSDALLYFGSKTTSAIKINLQFGLNGYKTNLVPSSEGTLIFGEEVCWFHEPGDSKQDTVVLGMGHRETKLYEADQQHRQKSIVNDVVTALKSWKVYHFHDTSDSAKVKQTGELNDNSFFRPDASNLAAFLYMLHERHGDHYRQIVKTIRLVAPFFDDFVLRPSPLNPDKIRLEWREQTSDSYLNAHTLSDGTLRFMCLAVLLLQPDLPSVILIDEPELGLHPYAIVLLAELLQAAAQKTQVIVSTQSVPLINQFAPDDILVVDREDRQSVFKRLAPQKLEIWLDEYGLGDLWEKNIIGGRPQNREVGS
jgi:predicted ATPase